MFNQSYVNQYQPYQQQQQPQNNIQQVQQLIQTIKNCGNPQQMMQSMIQNNPQLGIMGLLQQNGGNAKQAFYALAQQKGVNPDEILNMIK